MIVAFLKILGRSDNILIVVAVIFLLMIALLNWHSGDQTKTELVTGKAVEAGSVRLCLNRPAIVNFSCSLTAFVSQEFFCDVDAWRETGENITFYDNSSFFNINPATGVINFTPLAGDIGIHGINITAVDNSTCTNNGNTTIMILNITRALQEEPMGLNITRTGLDGALLNWSNITWAVSYNIYYSSQLESMRSLNFSNITNVSGITALYWNDTTAFQAPRRFYRIGAVNASVENVSLEIVGKLDLQFISNSDSSLGRNLFSIPFNRTYYANPFIDEMCSYAATITRLNREDANLENYESHTCASGIYNNFSMNLGEGFFVYINTSYNYTVVGEVSNDNLTIELISDIGGDQGRNLFGIHFPQQDQYMDPFIAELCSFNTIITRLNRQDPDFENYESHSCSSGSYNNFSMQPGEGFFMYLNTSQNKTVH